MNDTRPYLACPRCAYRIADDGSTQRRKLLREHIEEHVRESFTFIPALPPKVAREKVNNHDT
jgi:hypothetical protein